jgi:hypothetical protein
MSDPSVFETLGSDLSWLSSSMHTEAHCEFGVTWRATDLEMVKEATKMVANIDRAIMIMGVFSL